MHSDWIDRLREFEAAGVEYLLVGGHALTVHGYIRVTTDLDLLVRPTPENSRRVFAALTRFGAITVGLSPTDFANEQTVFGIGQRPLRIDVLAGIDGVTYDEAAEEAVATDFHGIACLAIGLKAFMRNKRASGRPKDLADVDWFETHHPDLRSDTPTRDGD